LEVEAVALDAVAGALFNRLNQISWKFDVKVADPATVQAGEVAVGISSVAVETTLCFFKALDHPIAVERFQVLVNGGMANPAAVGIEAIKDVAGAEMLSRAPQNFQHQAALAAEAQALLAAEPVGLIKPSGGAYSR
tara:strand:- start:269 stop:676 length:408 start_codon:yes stop_codon:yes gene_type:complete